MQDPLKSMAKFQEQFLPPMFGVEFCVALVGNAVGLWLMVTRERQRNWHTGLVFSCNLAASDLLYVLTLPLLVAYYSDGKRWHFGPAACKAERFLFTCNLYGSVLFVTAISVNRYVGVVHPFFARSHVRPRHAAAACVLVWAGVTALSAPVLSFAGACPKNASAPGGAVECSSTCARADEPRHFAYSVFLAVFGCLLPLLATAASYAAIFRVVWRNSNITLAEKKKVGLMVAAVLVLYAVSFVPYHVLRNYYLYQKINDRTTLKVYKAYQVSKGLVTLNMCLHPLLYMALIGSVRTLCCGGGGRGDTPAPAGQK